jgi:hypothetical protein
LRIHGLVLEDVLIAQLGNPPELPLPALVAFDFMRDVPQRDTHEAAAITEDCQVLEKARYLKLRAFHPVLMDLGIFMCEPEP